MKKFIVICPGGAATGGVELLHQLVDSINNFKNNSAYICYYPFGKEFKKPAQYEKYNCTAINISNVDKQVDVVILPEVYTYLVKNFKPKNVFVWWMSVDNYENSKSMIYAARNRFLPWRYINIKKKFDGAESIGGHLCQSEYAKLYLQENGIQNTLNLSDYINDQYIVSSEKFKESKREDVVVYNPAKGIELTNLVLDSLPNIKFSPIIDMSRDQIIDLLGKSKIYIDFGNHPGKDRIPREAAILGCCVITNTSGSANNDMDIPIPRKYKVDHSNLNLERKQVK